MTIRNFEFLFDPQSVAVIGASNRPNSVGSVVMHNLLEGGFGGPILPVNPKHETISGVLAYKDIESLPLAPDLAVICTPPQSVPDLIHQLGARGTRAAVVLTAGLSGLRDEAGRTLQELMLEAAKPYLLRILGPNGVGLIIPGIGLNASFAHTSALPGHIAFVSQSGALCTAVLDWARSNNVGFSHFISLGDSADVDFGDVLDYLAGDPSTRAILLYIESVRQARKFMSAARAAGRNKMVVAVKAGRAEAGARAAASHTGALAGRDDVYDTALRRAGILRVDTIEELFEAAETLERSRPLVGDRLAVVTNGGGAGVMAVDALIASGGRLAELSQTTMAKLNAVLPATWSKGNPVDIIGDAGPERYTQAVEALLADPGVDALLIMHAPTAVISRVEAARAVIAAVKEARQVILTCWLGEAAAEEPRHLFAQANIPTYETPESAVRAFLHLVEHQRNQETLRETPPSVAAEFIPDKAAARDVIEKALTDGRDILTEPEAKDVLSAFGIPVVETRAVESVDDALRAANKIGFPVALKILSPDISHKSDVGGVALDLETPEAVSQAAEAMVARLASLRPDARHFGFTVQKMARRPGAHELIAGVATDATFGPVIMYGQGGTAVEVINDQAVSLPPLNLALAGELISRTRISRLLGGYRDRPAVDREALQLSLVQLSQMVVDIPEIVEVDINPLLADDLGVLALDARIRVAPVTGIEAGAHLSIRPYPKDLEEEIDQQPDPHILMRPIRPEDEPEYRAFLKALTHKDRYARFFGAAGEMPHAQLARYTQIDYDREMTFVATRGAQDANASILGVGKTITDPDNRRADFAIAIREDMRTGALPRLLTDKLVRYTRDRGAEEMVGYVVPEDLTLLALAKDLGFQAREVSGEKVIEIKLKL